MSFGGKYLGGIDITGSWRKHSLASETTSRSLRHNCAVARGTEDINKRGKGNVIGCEK